MMTKNIFPLLIILLTIYSCTDEYSQDNYYNQGTDFSKDISNLTNFYMSTAVELKITNEKSINDTLRYNIGDTIKMSLELNAIFKEDKTDSYNLLKSTGANYYSFSLYKNSLHQVFENHCLDLTILEKYPETKNLTKTEIQSHPIYKDLILNNNNIKAYYNTLTKNYECKIGVVVISNTGTDITNKTQVAYINTSNYIRNESTEKDINISIPIVSFLNFKPIVINN